MTSTAIVWFRQDLRVADNPALHHALENHQCVVPVFIWDPGSDAPWAPGGASRWWLHHSLRALAERLEGLGSRLILRNGPTAQALSDLVAETGAGAVYWNRLYDPALIERDRGIKERLVDAGLEARSFNARLLFEPWEILKADGSPYLVFTPYWRQIQQRWRRLDVLPSPSTFGAPKQWPDSPTIDDLTLLPDRDWADGFHERWQPGELAAVERLESFLEDAVVDYDSDRDRPDRHGTSRMSAALHFGEVSPRQVALALDEAGELPAGEGRLSFLREIAWREFSAYLLFHFQQIPDQPLKAQFDHFPWREPADYADDLAAWQRGRTGVPMVDAGMRELWHTGWMHNRVRMIVASYLTKNLLIPWQEGARWFWDTLVDADLANNTQGWQWTAGSGADAAPYFRVFNPVLQGEKFDPDGEYVRRWCPELRAIGGTRVHQPEIAARDGRGYSSGSVDLKRTRARALAAYAQIKGK
ncbi:MAG: deoxyribodipyrimidine photo-lyase [Pseudomonadota bacterium]